MPRQKNIDTQVRWICEIVEQGIVLLKWTPETEQMADRLTKPVKRIQFQAFVAQAGMTQSNWGSLLKFRPQVKKMGGRRMRMVFVQNSESRSRTVFRLTHNRMNSVSLFKRNYNLAIPLYLSSFFSTQITLHLKWKVIPNWTFYMVSLLSSLLHSLLTYTATIPCNHESSNMYVAIFRFVKDLCRNI